MIQLPGTEVARIKVASQFGTNHLDEGSMCTIVSGGPIEKNYQVKLLESK
jgi:hypothetical protein